MAPQSEAIAADSQATDSNEITEQIKESNYIRLVQDGYDKIATRYLEWSVPSPARLIYLNKLLALLPPDPQVLELGCGAGKPCTQSIAEHAHVTGVDISAAQIALAQQYVPRAKLIHADMMTLSFPQESFHAITAFYSVIHLPRAQQAVLMGRIAGWLTAGGYLLANLGTTDNPGNVEAGWLGSEMYWSSFGVETNREMVKAAGLEILEAEVLGDDEDGKLVPFLWVLARKGEHGACKQSEIRSSNSFSSSSSSSS